MTFFSGFENLMGLVRKKRVKTLQLEKILNKKLRDQRMSKIKKKEAMKRRNNMKTIMG